MSRDVLGTTFLRTDGRLSPNILHVEFVNQLSDGHALDFGFGLIISHHRIESLVWCNGIDGHRTTAVWEVSAFRAHFDVITELFLQLSSFLAIDIVVRRLTGNVTRPKSQLLLDFRDQNLLFGWFVI